MQLLFNYDELRVICWAFLIILLISFVIFGCIDLGISLILPMLAKEGRYRRSIIEAGHTYQTGGQIFLVFMVILIYFAWPMLFVVLSNESRLIGGALLFIILISPLGLAVRNKIQNKIIACCFDKLWFSGSLLSVFFLGLFCGNLFVGIPFYFDANMNITYLAESNYLLSPFSFITGLLAITIVVSQTAVYLQIFMPDKVRHKINRLAFIFIFSTLILFLLAAYFIFHLEGYHILSVIRPNTDIHPMMSEIKSKPSLWLDNYGHLPNLWVLPVSVFISAFFSIVLVRTSQKKMAFLFSSCTIIAVILTAACSLFPFLIPSKVLLNSSLTLWDSTASKETLETIFWYALFYLVLMMIYLSNLVKRFHRNSLVIDKNQT